MPRLPFTYWLGCLFELGKGIILVILLLGLLHFFIGTVFIVQGYSMSPNFLNGDFLLVNRISYLIDQPKRGDVSVIKFPGDPERKKYIKRAIGLPMETIEIRQGKVWINQVELKELYLPTWVETTPSMKVDLGKDEYFLMGDNRPNSNDSRIWGIAERKNFIGRVTGIFFPFNRVGPIFPPTY